METKDCPISIICLGDIMPGGIMHGNNNYISKEVLSYLQKADIRIATLECAIGDEPNFDTEKMSRKKDIVYAPNLDIIKLQQMNINVVSLANNHIYDLGLYGLKNTIKQLELLGIKYCGAGNNIEEAGKPAIVEVNGKKIAFLAFCDYRDETVGYVPFADKDKPGINPLFDSNIYKSIKECKNKYDYVFVITHWGIEHTFYPTPEVWNMAEKIISFGADGIIGGHTHRIQPIKLKKNRIIIYSLGNFCFFDRYINKPRPTFYPPKNEDTSLYPITYKYPYVDRPTLKLWPNPSRIGIMVKITINNKFKYECKYTQLDNNNYINLYNKFNNKKFFIILKLVGLYVKLPFYIVIYKIIVLVRIIKNKFFYGFFIKK